MPARLPAELHNPFFHAMWDIQGIAPVPTTKDRNFIIKESKEEEKKNK